MTQLMLRALAAVLPAVLLAGLAAGVARAEPAATPAPSPAPAPAIPADALAQRIAELPGLMNGLIAPDAYFAPGFLAAVPPAQFEAIRQKFLADHGAASTAKLLPGGTATSASAEVGFARAIGSVRLTVAADGRVSGLLFTGFRVEGDNLAAIAAELATLPGQTSLVVQRLDGPAPSEALIAHNPTAQMAIGSTFKLYVLAELAGRIRRTGWRWDDVTTVDRRGFSSAATAAWPLDAPVTVHTLATWMISVSDNAATDILMGLLGRDAIGRKLQQIGHSEPSRTLPLLTTVEAFALKSAANAPLRAAFLAADERGQAALLAKSADRLTMDRLPDNSELAGPLHIDTIEWFASSADLVRLLDHYRKMPGGTVWKILAANPGVPPASAAGWRYVGYKGGSEPGVISMSYLLEAKSGRWYAATASWNNTAARVDDGAFALLMQRLVDQLAVVDAAGS